MPGKVIRFCDYERRTGGSHCPRHDGKIIAFPYMPRRRQYESEGFTVTTVVLPDGGILIESMEVTKCR